MIRASEIYERLQNKVQPYFEIMKPYLGLSQSVCGIYLLWVVVHLYLLWVVIHFVSVHMYMRFCTPSTLTGFLMSPFMAAAPHCQALRWSIYNGGNSIVSMWMTLGVWLMGYFPLFHQKIDNTADRKTEKIE
jgi:hypothetical protein